MKIQKQTEKEKEKTCKQRNPALFGFPWTHLSTAQHCLVMIFPHVSHDSLSYINCLPVSRTLSGLYFVHLYPPFILLLIYSSQFPSISDYVHRDPSHMQTYKLAFVLFQGRFWVHVSSNLSEQLIWCVVGSPHTFSCPNNSSEACHKFSQSKQWNELPSSI